MKTNEIARACGWRLLAGEEAHSAEVTGCYTGDLLSWVMARAQPGQVWVTVMGNINAIAVAALTEVAAIVLTENAPLDADAAQKARQQGISVYTCEKNSYETATEIYEMLNV